MPLDPGYGTRMFILGDSVAAPSLRKMKVLVSSHRVLVWSRGSVAGFAGPSWLPFPGSVLRSLLLLSLLLVFWFTHRLCPTTQTHYSVAWMCLCPS